MRMRGRASTGQTAWNVAASMLRADRPPLPLVWFEVGECRKCVPALPAWPASNFVASQVDAPRRYAAAVVVSGAASLNVPRTWGSDCPWIASAQLC